MSQKGWIRLDRKIQDHWLWSKDKPFDVRSAWFDLLLSANHKDNKFPLGSEMVFVERGSFITSERKLGEKWGWSNTRVRNFLKLLESDGMIVKKTDSKKSTVTIVNYSIYQDKESSGASQEKQLESSGASQEHTNNNDITIYNNDNHEYKEDLSNGSELGDTTPNSNKILLPLIDGSFYEVPQEKLNQWITVFSTVDVIKELEKMYLWLDSNPKKKKTRRGINRFVESWLGRALDKGCYGVSTNGTKLTGEGWKDKWKGWAEENE